jgi:hypothetical protein
MLLANSLYSNGLLDRMDNVRFRTTGRAVNDFKVILLLLDNLAEDGLTRAPGLIHQASSPCWILAVPDVQYIKHNICGEGNVAGTKEKRKIRMLDESRGRNVTDGHVQQRCSLSGSMFPAVKQRKMERENVKI